MYPAAAAGAPTESHASHDVSTPTPSSVSRLSLSQHISAQSSPQPSHAQAAPAPAPAPAMTYRPASPSSSMPPPPPPLPAPSYFPDILPSPPTSAFGALELSRQDSAASSSAASAASPGFTSPASSAAASVIGDAESEPSTAQSSLASSSFDLFASKPCASDAAAAAAQVIPAAAAPAPDTAADTEPWASTSNVGSYSPRRPSLSSSPTDTDGFEPSLASASASYSPTDGSQSSLTSLSVHSTSPPVGCSSFGLSKASPHPHPHPHLAPLPSPLPPRHIQPSASLEHARSLLEHQAASLLAAARRLREEQETWLEFEGAQHLIVDALKRGGKLVWTGVGKSGIIARKLSCTSLSLGLPSTFLDPMGALHGDLGMLNGAAPGSAFASMRSTSHLPPPPCDVLIALSHSGSSGELIAMLPHVKLRGVKVIALTAKKDSTLGQAALQSGGCWIDCRTAGRGGWPETPGSCSRADSFSEGSSSVGEQQQQQSAQNYGFPPCSSQQAASDELSPAPAPYCAAARFVSALTAPPAGGTDEADPDLPAPTSSTTTALAMGDSLVLSCARLLGLGTPEFGKNHPGGALGKRMMAELQPGGVGVDVDVEVKVRAEDAGAPAPAHAAATAVAVNA